MSISRVLSFTVEALSRAHAAAWVCSGRPVIYGARLNGPLKIASGENMLIARCHFAGDGIAIEVPSHVPADWSER